MSQQHVEFVDFSVKRGVLYRETILYMIWHAISCKEWFPCKAQCDGFKSLLADKPQDHFSGSGNMTTNAVEGFHGLALMYRDN